MTFERRMSHLDAVLFALETPTNHMHLGLLATFGPVGPGVDVAQVLRDHIGADAVGYNSLRLIVRRQLGGFASPMLIDGGPVDLNYHVRTVALNESTDSALDQWVATELSVPFNRSKPLWTVTVLSNCADGGFALFIKGHHGVFDGVAALKVAIQIFEQKPLRVERRRPIRLGRLRNLAESVGELITWPARVVRVATDSTRHAARLAQPGRSPRMFSAPSTALNISISSKRAVARTVLPLGRVADVRRSAGCTANDVVIAMVSASVRAVLIKRKELPSRSLITLVPSAQSGVDWGGRSGNRLAFWFVSMATDVANPIERLRLIAESSKVARTTARLRGANVWNRLAGMSLTTPLNLVMRVGERLNVWNHLPPLASIIISNVTGPRSAVTLAGATMTGLYPFGPPKDGGAVNVTVVSYGDGLYVGLQGDLTLAPVMDEIAAGLPAALAELEGALVR